MIELKNIYKDYKLGNTIVTALKDINLQIKDGEMVVVFGPSGSGKSTLLNLIGAMDKPTKGHVFIDSEEISGYSASKLTSFRARKVGFIFQTFNLIPVLNVYENIVVPMKLKGQKYKRKKVLELIENVGLMKFIKHRPDELSGGQRQRVAIARALVHNPPYILADEPTANLDSQTGTTIVNLLKELNSNTGVTIIFASHDDCVLDNIERKIRLRDGEYKGNMN